MSSIFQISNQEIKKCKNLAIKSERGRYAKLMHSQGDYHNKVFNFISHGSYMKPHMHPGEEKIEKIYMVEGEASVIFFDESGKFESSHRMTAKQNEMISVPAFKWHTYVMHSEWVVTFETMDGIYDPETWKKFAQWAPEELSEESKSYLDSLRVLGNVNERKNGCFK